MNGGQLLLLWSAFLIGVTVESLFAVDFFFLILLLFGACITGGSWRVKNNIWFLVASLCCLLLVVGVARTSQFENQFENSPLASAVGQEVLLTGLVVSEADQRLNFTQVYIQTETDKVLVRVDRYYDINYGDLVEIKGEVAKPKVFETDTGRIFDYPKYLQVRGVEYVVSFASVNTLQKDQGNILLSYIYQVKRYFIDKLKGSIASPQVDLGVGLLLGVKQALGDDLETAFRQTGIIHIVVLSGYNIMLVVGFFWWLSSWVLPLRGRIIFGLVGITVFALLVGLSATVLRASIMAAILLIGKLIGRKYDVLRSLLFAAMVMVCINPYILLYDIGFQLSFMATLGLVLVLPQFESTLATNSTKLKLKDLFWATVVTQIFVLPLLMYHIGEISLVSVLVNMLVLPMVPAAMMITFITGLVSMVSVPLGAVIGLLAYLPLHYIIIMSKTFAALPFAVVTIPQIPVVLLVLMYVLLGLGYWWWMHSRSVKAEPAITQSIQMSDWQVVDEINIKADLEYDDSKSADTPVFFR